MIPFKKRRATYCCTMRSTKETFKELLTKTHLNVYFVPNVLFTYFLHNLLEFQT